MKQIESVINDIRAEHEFAITHFPPFYSPHEGYAIILEEVRELEQEVFKHQKVRDITKMRKEALQIATMAIRFIIDLCDERER